MAWVLLALTVAIVAAWKLIPFAPLAFAGVLVIIGMWVWYFTRYRRRQRVARY